MSGKGRGVKRKKGTGGGWGRGVRVVAGPGRRHGRPKKKGKGVGKNHGWRLVHSRAGEDSGDKDLFNESDEDDVGREEGHGGVVENVVSVAIVPGKGWDTKAATDEDSNVEEVPTAKGRRLPRIILAGEAELTHRRQNQARARARPVVGEEEDTQEEDSHEEEEEGELEWQFDEPIPGKLGTKIPNYTAPIWTYDQEVRLEECTTALHWYKVFSSREWLLYVEEQSQNYPGDQS